MRLNCALVFLLMGYLSIHAQQSLSLNEAIAKALENNYKIQIVEGAEQSANIQNSWGAAGRFPYINLSLANANSLNRTAVDDNLTNRLGGDLTLNWTLFEGFKVKIAKQRFEELEKLSTQNTAIVVEGTIQSVILAYYNALLQREKLKTYQQVMSLSEDRYTQARERKEYGAAVTYEVLQAENAYLSDKSSYLLQEVAYKNALRDLAFLMAEEADMNLVLSNEFEAIPKDYSLEDLNSILKENNKALQNQYLNQRLLENAVAVAKSSYMPKLNMLAGVSGARQRVDWEGSGVDWTTTASAYGNFTLSMNLYSGGERNRAKQIAKIKEDIGVIEITEMEHDLRLSLSNLYEYYEVRRELLTVAEQNMKAAELNMSISREKFKAGAINSFNYRDVQIIYLNASQNRLEAIYQFIDTHTSLLRLIGTIVQEY